MPTRCLLILLDGLGDRSHPELAHCTPLQAARTPFLDHVASLGANGLFHAARPGIALPSENAHFALFGYGPEDFPGRGALEALGAGLPLGPDQVAVLAHFSHLTATQGGALVLSRDVLRDADEHADALFQAVGAFEAEGVRVRLHRTSGLWAVLILSGAVSPHVTDTNPMRKDCLLSAVRPLAGHADDPAAQRTARVLTAYLRWAHAQLAEHPVNAARRAQGQAPATGLVTQRAGRLRPVRPFARRFGLRGLSIASGVMYRGLATFLGLDFKRVADTDDPGRDLAERVALAHTRLADHDFIHVHTKAPDQAAHAKSPEKKRAVIEALDTGLAASLPPLLDDPDTLVAVTADHSTPSAGPLIHSGEPVPLVFAGAGVRRDAVARFDEIHAATGALGMLRGTEFMHMVLNYLDKARLRGIHDTADIPDYWPGDYPPFTLED